MKQTVTINLNGIVFHIDNDAFELLQDYLQTIENTINADEKTDVMQDIEARIAELFTNSMRTQGINVVNVSMIEKVMEQLGAPEAFADDDEPKQQQQSNKNTPKRFYRDGRDELLGGVCAGIAAYFAIDPLWVRLLFAFAGVFYGGGILLYLLLWIIVPKAQTAAQRLEMRGEEPSAQNIEKEVLRTKQEELSNHGCLYQGISIILKIGMGLFILCLAPCLLFTLFIIGVILFALFATMFGMIPVGLASHPLFATLGTDSTWAILLMFFSLLIILIPIVMFITWLVKRFGQNKTVSSRFWWITSIIWILSLLGAGTTTVYGLVNNSQAFTMLDDIDDDWDDPVGPAVDIAVEPFHSIVVMGAADVKLSQGPQAVSYRTNRYTEVQAEVKDEVLLLTIKNNHTRHGNADIFITIPEIQKITLSGAADLETVGVLNAKDLQIVQSGAADIKLNLQAETISIQSSGASETSLSGAVTNLNLNIQGASEVDADKLQAQHVDVVAAGASDIEIYAAQTLAVQAMGASKVEYHGNPTITKNITAGMSVVRHDR